MTPDDIVSYWEGLGPKVWFSRSDEVDREVRGRFGALIDPAARGEFAGWQESAQGALALVLVLDQFPRNAFRGAAQAFSYDAIAREVADAAIAVGHDGSFEFPMRRFFFLPFMHGETLEDQERCLALCEAAGDEDGVKHATEHRDIVARFGRFPHRNAVLGRVTTPEEARFLADGGFSG